MDNKQKKTIEKILEKREATEIMSRAMSIMKLSLIFGIVGGLIGLIDAPVKEAINLGLLITASGTALGFIMLLMFGTGWYNKKKEEFTIYVAQNMSFDEAIEKLGLKPEPDKK
jgi:hypothetical protein